MCESVCFGLHCNASHPLAINREGEQRITQQKSERKNTHLEVSQGRCVPGKESKTRFLSPSRQRSQMRVLCGVVNKLFSWSGDSLERAALVSNIIYSLDPCERHTNTHTHTVTEISKFIPSRASDQPHSLACVFLPPIFFLASLKINKKKIKIIQGLFCHLTLHFMQYSFDGGESSSHTQWIFINSARCWLVKEGQQAWSTLLCGYVHSHSPATPLSKLQARALFRTTGIWQWFMEKGSHTTTLIHTGAQSKVTSPNMGTKKGYYTSNKSFTDSSARCGPGSTPPQCSPTETQPTS